MMTGGHQLGARLSSREQVLVRAACQSRDLSSSRPAFRSSAPLARLAEDTGSYPCRPADRAREVDLLGRQVADAIADQLPEAGSLTWASRAAP